MDSKKPVTPLSAARKTDPVQQSFEKLGLDLPEMVTSSTAAMRSVAAFLIEHNVFDVDPDDLRRRVEDDQDSGA